MSDGAIQAPVAVLPAKSASPAQAVEKIIALPDGLLPDTPLPAQVTANADGRITLQTAQGAIVLEAPIALEIGQKIIVQIADGGQTIALTLDTADVNPLPVKLSSPALLQPVASDPVIIHNDVPLTAFAPLQAKIVSLPVPFDETALPILVKSLAQLPPQNPLPPALAEGLEKFQQLASIIQQTSLSPVASKNQVPVALPKNTVQVQQQAAVIATLQQALTPQAPADNAFAKALPHNLLHLQTIAPGQPVSPEIILNLRLQLASLQPSPPVASLPVTGSSQTSTVPATPLPIIGVVLQPTTPLPVSPSQSPLPQAIMLMTQPDGTDHAPQLIAVMAMPTSAPVASPLVPLATMMAQNAPLPGTVLVAAIMPQSSEPVIITPLPIGTAETVEKIPALHTALGETWPALETIFAAAAHDMPPVMQQTLPTPTIQHLPPAMLFFMAVIKNGFTDQWLNDPSVEKLPKVEKSGALAQIARDLQNIAARSDDTLPADAWRPLPVPLQVGDQLLRLQWFYRHPQDDAAQGQGADSDKSKKKKTRFLLNVPKTMLGDIQLDGLVQEQNLEVILRTESALPRMMEAAIRSRYGAALETTGMAGALHFQVGREQYVRV